MTTRNARNQKAWRDRQKVKKDREKAMIREILDAIEVELPNDGDNALEFVLPKDSPAYTTFQLLAADKGISNLELWGELAEAIARKVKMMIAGV